MFMTFWNYAHIVVEPSGWAVVIRCALRENASFALFDVAKLSTQLLWWSMVGLYQLYFGGICGWVSCDATKLPEVGSWRVWCVQWTLQAQKVFGFLQKTLKYRYFRSLTAQHELGFAAI